MEFRRHGMLSMPNVYGVAALANLQFLQIGMLVLWKNVNNLGLSGVLFVMTYPVCLLSILCSEVQIIGLNVV